MVLKEYVAILFGFLIYSFFPIQSVCYGEFLEAFTGFQMPIENDHKGYDFLDWSEEASSYHPGVDLNGKGDDNDDPVFSIANGKVVFATTENWGGIVIQHLYQGQMWYSQYGHVDKIYVVKGQMVTKGMMIAEIGNIPPSTSPHLHFEIRKAEHPSPEKGDFWDLIAFQRPEEITVWYENPISFISSHAPYGKGDINADGDINLKDVIGCLQVLSGKYQDSIIQNGSFEIGIDPPSGGYRTLSAINNDLSGWTVTTGNVDWVKTYYAASDGELSLDLVGLVAGEIEQTFPTTIGKKYSVTFDIAGNPVTYRGTTELRVEAAGQYSDFSFNNTGMDTTNMGWETNSWIFTATESLTKLSFKSLGDFNRSGPALDNVSVSENFSVIKADVNNDSKIGLEEALYALNQIANINSDLIFIDDYKETIPKFNISDNVNYDISNGILTLSDGWHYIYYNEQISTPNYTIELKVKSESGDGYGVFWKANASSSINGHGIQYQTEWDKIIMMEYPSTESWWDEVSYITDRDWAIIKIEIRGSLVDININGEKIYSFVDNMDGRLFGLRNWRGITHVDYIKVYSNL